MHPSGDATKGEGGVRVNANHVQLTVDQISAMRKQEVLYRCDDYLCASSRRHSTPKRLISDCPLHLQQAAVKEICDLVERLSYNKEVKLTSRENEDKKPSSSSIIPDHEFSSFRSAPCISKVSPSSVTAFDFQGLTSATSAMHHHQGANIVDHEILLEKKRVKGKCTFDKHREAILRHWRTEMCDWSYNIVDQYGFNPEYVAIAFSHVDRFISLDRKKMLVSRKYYQLLVATSLYMVTKMYEPGKNFTIDSLNRVCGNVFSIQSIETMELDLLSTLQWRVNPPSALSFVRLFLDLFPVRSLDERHQIYQSCKYLAELAVFEPFFVSQDSSSLAAACVVVSAVYGSSSNQSLDDFMNNMKSLVDIDTTAEKMKHILRKVEKLNV